MATEADIISRVRLELGDQPQPFRQTYRGNGNQDQYDLPTNHIITTSDLHVFTTDPTTLVNTTLALGTDFTLDSDNGIIVLTTYLPKDVLLTVEGKAYGLFSDDELSQFVREAVLQHTNAATQTTRYRDSNGFIRYDKVAVTLDNLPEVENLLVAILASIEALWALSTDAATDIDVVTSEGTHIPRSQRFAQIRAQIDTLTEKYQTLCGQLNVGLWRIEMSNLRRVSRTTNRLVPIYVEREYDDPTYPERIITEIDQRGADPDGPPSQNGWGYY